jgi:hypothetical protein
VGPAILTPVGSIRGDDPGVYDAIPPELFLDGFPGPMRDIAEHLREIVRRTEPEALERVRTGWRLIGYDLPAGRRTVFFAFVIPEPVHVHLGFQYGSTMRDPERVLDGDGVTKRARWLTFRPTDPIDEPATEALIREGARVALMSPGERLAIAHDREFGDWD